MTGPIYRFLDAVLPRRVTTRREYLAAVDGLRFLAIAWVVLFHLNSYFIVKTGIAPSHPLESAMAWFFARGDWGVALFFVISGFILGLPFASQHLHRGKKVSLKKYFLRRLTRLEPPYIAAMLAAAALAVVIRHDPIGQVLDHLVSHLGYLHQFTHGDAGLSVVVWSLEIEVQFYILAPLLGLIFVVPLRFRRPLLCVGILGFGGLGKYLAEIEATKSILNYLHLFLCGFLLADLHLGSPSETGGTGLRDAIGFALLVALPFVVANEFAAAYAAPLVITAFYYCVLRGNLLRRALSSLVISRIGGMCYSMYLLHFLVISATGRFVIGHVGNSYTAGLMLVASVCLPAILLSTIVFFRAIELPCMRPDWPSRVAGMFRSSPQST